jgi:peptidoglycan hydrolase-like protein with peptidoglycan-binding domain
MRILDLGILQPGTSVKTALEQARSGVSARGFLPATMPFLPATVVAPAPAFNAKDDAYWEAVQAIGSIEAIETYLARYPRGVHVFEASQLINELRATPGRLAQEAEDRLRLSRENRRQVQRNLSLLGFDPHGVDGVFGRGSRAAIAAWQRSRRFDETGYLPGNQVNALQTAADQRARELEEEARLRQQEQERQDASYWRQTGRGGTEDGLQAYLRRYPDGVYADVARRKINVFEEERRREAAANERRFWDDARSAGTEQAYIDFLKQFPNGVFAKAARQRIADIRNSAQDSDLLEQAKAEEELVAGNPITRLLVEKKLDSLGLDLGRVDGRFDEYTRKAIRRFQRARNIPVTGYVTQQTIVRMLAAQ